MPIELATWLNPVLLAKLLYGIMLVGLLLIVMVPFFPGVILILAAIAAWVGYSAYFLHAGLGFQPTALALVIVVGLAALTSAWWTEKLGLRFTYTTREVVWGMLIGSLAFGFILGGTLWFMMGMLLGAIAMEAQDRRPLPEAIRRGIADVYSALGPRGLQLLAALIIIDAAIPLGVHAAPDWLHLP